ncbi:MAG TPA: plasmid pRiA4b ORF-3 family protein [Oligoflexus sp.]|uniref:plasmid pRiA4b ORF-3 family protein n=1 Tax=Oligoflexus sp. TaxID=1971216 RepID=UPI002D7F2B04|nr:plasmid pRiA4b ORF-3 family protein [Oligoflexus sp.]HET9237907.1 plasmid pRiA4b ORF-3 family protein [Oligoflexus sp.]
MQGDPNKHKKRGEIGLRLVPKEEQDVTLHISLSDIEPRIWRRLQVSDAISLHELHLAIQGAFGWKNNHLHSFIVKQGEVYSSRPSAFDFSAEDEEGDSRTIYLRDLIGRQVKSFRYVYDMGDNWMHKIKIEQVQSKTRDSLTPVCVDGARHTPPEDCGGSLGYEELLEALEDAQHPSHAEALRSLTQSFDPQQFNLRQANAQIKKMLDGNKR